jgi:hypothetical protein
MEPVSSTPLVRRYSKVQRYAEDVQKTLRICVIDSTDCGGGKRLMKNLSGVAWIPTQVNSIWKSKNTQAGFPGGKDVKSV